MGSTIMILVSLTAMSIVCDNVFAGMPTQCNPGYLDDLPPRIRKVCAALSRMYEFGPEIESYVEEKQSHIPGATQEFNAISVKGRTCFRGILIYICTIQEKNLIEKFRCSKPGSYP